MDPLGHTDSTPQRAAYFESAFGQAPDPVLAVDADGLVFYRNPAATRRLAAEAHVRALAGSAEEGGESRLAYIVRTVLQARRAVTEVLDLKTREGPSARMRVAAYAAGDGDGAVACVLSCSDVPASEAIPLVPPRPLYALGNGPSDAPDEALDTEVDRRFAQRMATQNRVFVRLAREMTQAWSDPPAFLRRVTEEIARAFDVERVGIWVADEAFEQIRCLNSFDRKTVQHTEGEVLLRADIPHYFDALTQERVIVAHDAATDPRTFELKWNYLRQHGITSMLDAPIRVGDRLVGVVCHEHIGPLRRWAVEDQAFATATADFVALALETIRRVEAENAARTHEQFLSRILDTSPNVIFVKDEQGRFVVVNERFAELFGRSPDEIAGRRHADFNDDRAEVERFAQYDAQVLTTNQIIHLPEDMTLSRQTGMEQRFQTRLIPLEDDQGKRYVLGIANDITARWQYEQALKAEKARAESASRFKSTLLANLNHEFRTPLTAILGFSEMLRQPTDLDAAEIAEHAAHIHDNGRRLMSTLNTMLDMAQLESGSFQIRADEVDLATEIPRLVEGFRAQAARRNIALRVIPPALTSPVRLSQAVLDRIVRNLVSNAIKFTERGSVTVRAADEGEAVRLQVSDTGIGISEDFLPHVTEPFRQQSEGLTRTHEGSGLGLAIVHHLLHLVGGTLHVESTPAQGSTFTVRLPVERAA